jgi:hypothetical protein
MALDGISGRGVGFGFDGQELRHVSACCLLQQLLYVSTPATE